MAVDGVGQTGSTTNTTQTGSTSTTHKSLGQDAFLQLLTVQLAHQDPTAPQDNGEMISQMATFSSLEQLTQMNTTLTAISKALNIPSTTDGQTSTSDKTTTGTTEA